MDMNSPSINSHKQQPTLNNLKTTRSLVMGLIVVVLLAVGFMAGVSYQKGKHVATTATTASQNGGFGGGGRRGGGFGTVTAVSASSITVQSRSGASTTYSIAGSTQVTNNGAAATVNDIQVGDTVAVTPDTTTTTQADRILLNPSFGGGAGGGQGASPGASTNSTGATNPSTTALPSQTN
jgi:hypothetical protein